MLVQTINQCLFSEKKDPVPKIGTQTFAQSSEMFREKPVATLMEKWLLFRCLDRYKAGVVHASNILHLHLFQGCQVCF